MPLPPQCILNDPDPRPSFLYLERHRTIRHKESYQGLNVAQWQSSCLTSMRPVWGAGHMTSPECVDPAPISAARWRGKCSGLVAYRQGRCGHSYPASPVPVPELPKKMEICFTRKKAAITFASTLQRPHTGPQLYQDTRTTWRGFSLKKWPPKDTAIC